jgi:hypothetical protein
VLDLLVHRTPGSPRRGDLLHRTSIATPCRQRVKLDLDVDRRPAAVQRRHVEIKLHQFGA